MATTTTETVVSFYYTIPTLIDRINLGVLYKARRRDDILGLGENSVIDAELLIKEYIGSISADIFSKLMSPLGRTLEDLETPQEPYEFDVTFNDGTDDHLECVVYRVILPTKFDATTKPSIEKAIADTIVSYGIWQWLMDSNMQGWEKYEYEHIRKYDDLRSLMTRRINLKRTYKLY
jgi:hypothetical protein